MLRTGTNWHTGRLLEAGEDFCPQRDLLPQVSKGDILRFADHRKETLLTSSKQME
jgi:hypothetical protein